MWGRGWGLAFTSDDKTDRKDAIDLAEAKIEDANQEVDEAIRGLDNTSDEYFTPILDRMRDQTIAYANRNALVIAHRFRQVRRALIGLAAVVFLIGVLFGGLTTTVVHHNASEGKKFREQTELSRYVGSYNACLNTNARSLAAQKTLANLLRPVKGETRQHAIARTSRLILQFGNEIAPLRTNQGNVFTEPLPNPIPHSWQVACSEYATKQIEVIKIGKLPPAASKILH